MNKAFTLILCLNLFAIVCIAKTWQVGTSRKYTKPSQVSTLVQNGDTVAIDSGLYSSDVAYWTANNLVLTGVNGMARLWSNGNVYGGKAIWEIGGNNAVVRYIEFAQAACPDNNGAGIRQEGINLTVQHCYFHDNQDGILAGDNITSNILIENTEFNHNGAGDGYSHNLYINHIHNLTFQFNYSHDAVVGHELKSRAYNNYILYNRFSDESTGTASRDLDLPNGGLAVILGNIIEKGPNAQNSNVMEFGLEGFVDPDSTIYIVNNTFVNDRTNACTFIQLQSGTALCKAYNNIFAGSGTIITGNAIKIDSSSNWAGVIANAGFNNASNYDYTLLSGSPEINKGSNTGSVDSFSLTPVYQYVYPTGQTSRVSKGKLDIGAFGFGTNSGVNINNISKNIDLEAFPNPGGNVFHIKLPDGAILSRYQITIHDMNGRLISNSSIDHANALEINATAWLSGIYFVEFLSETGQNYSSRLVVQR